MRIKFIVILCLMTSLVYAQSNKDSFKSIIDNFEKEYSQLNIPPLEISYANNLRNIRPAEELLTQKQFFTKYQSLINRLPVHDLSEQEQITCAVLAYEIDLNLERIQLEKKWLSAAKPVNGTRVYDEHLGKAWYTYFLKKWIDKDLTPDAAYQFGLKEIEKVKSAMAAIQTQMGMDAPAFKRELENKKYFISSKEEVVEKYNSLKSKVRTTAKPYFPDVDKVPPVKIEAGTNEDLAIVPAFYYENTFYFNFFDEAYDRRDMGWIFLHEAIPGHHYQHHLNEQLNTPVRNLFTYMSYMEGWGAYIEQFGNELGVYESPMDAYAQLQWDLIRSIRVALDVALNYYGWSDEKALAFWNQHLPDKEDVAQREIKRMKRWPAQVITYKYGKYILDELKGNKNTPAELKAFHKQVLEFGAIPLSVLQNHIQHQQ